MTEKHVDRQSRRAVRSLIQRCPHPCHRPRRRIRHGQNRLARLQSRADNDRFRRGASGTAASGPSAGQTAITLANHVARAIQEEFPGHKVALYAYNQHSPPPAVAVDSNVVVTPGTTNLLAIQVLRSGMSEIGVGGLLFPSFVFTGPRLERRAPIFDESIRLLPGGAIEKVKP